jgi:ABC-type antimicrobial peptide transport system ATPase subunit
VAYGLRIRGFAGPRAQLESIVVSSLMRAVYFHLGELVEEGETKRIFTQPIDRRTQDHVAGRFG